MSDEKLSSDEVPPRFSEWLLAMGCPPEDVPPNDKIAEMCRGQYYMVWRSLMEHVGPKDIILKKRLQVFNNDIVKCQKKNLFNKLDVNMPKELTLWRRHSELKQQVADTEAKLAQRKENLHQLLDKISSKLAQRNLSRKRLEDAQRRSWLLQQVATELRERRTNLQETKTIAHSLCCLDDSQDVEGKLDKCLCAISRPATATAASRLGVSLLSVANPSASSSLVSANGDDDADEHIASLVKCRGDVVFKQVFERRAGLCRLPAASPATNKHTDRQTPQSVLAHTAALHCTLALEAIKNRTHVEQARKRLATTLNELDDYMSTEACELLVLRCELAHSAARAAALRAAWDDVRTRSGVFAAARGDHAPHPATLLHNLDKSILSKRDELKRLIVSSAAIERKTQNVKERLIATFNSLHPTENRFNDQISVPNTPQEPVSTIRQFYEERRERRKNKLELSMNLDVSEGCSYNELTDNGSPKFIDELRMYMKKFNLEKNRKLVLESGEKIWIFQTIQSTINSLHSQWQDNEITTSMLCPSVCLSRNLAELTQVVIRKRDLESMVHFLLDASKKHDFSKFDITSTEEEQKTLDKLKKRLNENLLSLQKTGKTLDLGMENLNLWAANNVKQYISDNRTVDGRTYRDYERAFLDS